MSFTALDGAGQRDGAADRSEQVTTEAALASPDVAAYAWVSALVDELSRAGVSDACVAPGSRSTPLALALAHHEAMRVWMHVDERSAAFFALGMAKAGGRPVVVVCTSGTAAANFLPAVVEARLSGVPLVVLTADRPPELRGDVGAPQTIDQSQLFGRHVKWFVDAPLPEATPALLRQVRTMGARAVSVALARPAGPVHLNLPFREPLVLRSVTVPDWWDNSSRLAWAGRPDGESWLRMDDSPPQMDATTLDELATLLADAERPAIVCGPHADEALAVPLAAIARRLDAPLVADALSQLRFGTRADTLVIDAHDSFLRDDVTADALAPDVVLRVGELPTSKALQLWLQRHADARQVLLGDGRLAHPAQGSAWWVRAEPAAACVALDSALARMLGDTPAADADWAARWRRVNARARAAIDEVLEDDDALSEPRLFAELVSALPAGTTLWVSSSMPVRDLDSFAARRDVSLRTLANRGANGIDGVISSALGAAAVSDGPTVLAIGDLAFYHDMNGLLAARVHDLDATIVLVNNDGGGIFSFLPQGDERNVARQDFEALFGTPHGLDFAYAAALYGARFARPENWPAFRTALGAAINAPGLDVIEIRTDRARNVEEHRAVWSAVRAAVEEVL